VTFANLGHPQFSWYFARRGAKIQTKHSVFLGKELIMSIVRVGLAETKNYEEGWELIFGSKKKEEAKDKEKKEEPKAEAKVEDKKPG
jgi:hypothetical protein